MTYKECLIELEEINLKDDFIKEVEPLIKYLEDVKKIDYIKSTAGLINYALYGRLNSLDTDIYNKWVKAMHYLLTPKFARTKHQLDL